MVFYESIVAYDFSSKTSDTTEKSIPDLEISLDLEFYGLSYNFKSSTEF